MISININGRVKAAPCLDCADRYIGCHGNCDKYKDFKNEANEVSEKAKAARYADSIRIATKKSAWKVAI